MPKLKIIKLKNGKYIVRQFVPERKYLYFFTKSAHWKGILFSMWTNNEIEFKSFDAALSCAKQYMKEPFKLLPMEGEDA